MSRLGALGALGVAVLVLCVPAPRAGAADGFTITLETGLDGYVVAGRSIPIRVTVAAGRTTRGTVKLEGTGGPQPAVVERALGLAAGTSKSFWMVLPASPMFGEVGPPTVRFLEGGDRSTTATSQFLTSTTLVGVLPQLAAALPPPGTVTLPADTGEARIGVLSAEQLELGSAGLELFAVIAASAKDLVNLSDTARTTLLHWINRGGSAAGRG